MGGILNNPSSNLKTSMKRMSLFILIIYHIITTAQVQNSLVKYKQVQINDTLSSVQLAENLKNPAYLLFNENEAVYMYASRKIPDTKIKFDNLGKIIYKDIKNKVMITRDNYLLTEIAKKAIIYVEETNDKFPKFNWSMTTESKKIGSFTCYKATCYFRGRHWEAWYCPDIPVKMGPWKFYGLPGLILEVYDKDKKINFLFEEIEIPATNKLILEDIRLEIKPYYGTYKATWEDYKERYKTLIQKDMEAFVKRINAENQARGDSFRMEYIEKKSIEPPIELEFEY